VGVQAHNQHGARREFGICAVLPSLTEREGDDMSPGNMAKRAKSVDPAPLSYASYLSAKRTVDDRALNQHVVGVLRRQLASSDPLKVLEIGAGIGTMAARLADWNVLTHADYTLLDIDQGVVDEAPKWLTRWATSTGRTVTQADGCLCVEGGSPAVAMTLRFACADLQVFLDARHPSKSLDLLIANAFLDLVDVPATLPALFDLLAPNGLYWFSINFDGETLSCSLRTLPMQRSSESITAAWINAFGRDDRQATAKQGGTFFNIYKRLVHESLPPAAPTGSFMRSTVSIRQTKPSFSATSCTRSTRS
jgi:SAM-dependent methyltransferase